MKKVFIIGIAILLFTGIVYSNSGPPMRDPVDQSIIFNEDSGVSLIRRMGDYSI